jgi:hypothetical protein
MSKTKTNARETREEHEKHENPKGFIVMIRLLHHNISSDYH